MDQQVNQNILKDTQNPQDYGYLPVVSTDPPSIYTSQKSPLKEGFLWYFLCFLFLFLAVGFILYFFLFNKLVFTTQTIIPTPTQLVSIQNITEQIPEQKEVDDIQMVSIENDLKTLNALIDQL